RARHGAPAEPTGRPPATRAVGPAAPPSPRPVRPSPSVVVAVTVTGAPAARERASSASARRGPRRGRFPMTWTATFPISNPAARTRRAAPASRPDPVAPAPAGRLGAQV